MHLMTSHSRGRSTVDTGATGPWQGPLTWLVPEGLHGGYQYTKMVYSCESRQPPSPPGGGETTSPAVLATFADSTRKFYAVVWRRG